MNKRKSSIENGNSCQSICKNQLSTWVAMMAASLIALSHSSAEILVYKADLKNAKGTQINDGVTTPWGTSSANISYYLIFNLDGIDATQKDILTFNNKSYVPGSLCIDPQSRLCTKEVDDYLPPKANDVDKTIYGVCRQGNNRIFNILYMQRDAANQSGTHDTGVGTASGLATLQNIGGGFTGYYANLLQFIITRLDGGFDGSVGSYKDGRQWKNATVPLYLDIALTKAANDRRLNKTQTMTYICNLPVNANYRIKITYSNSSGDVGWER